MATKKKKAVRRTADKPKPRPKRKSARALAPVAVQPGATAPNANGLFFTLLFLVLLGLSWLGLRSCSPKPPLPVVSAVPAAQQASPPQAPAARSVAPAVSEKVETPKVKSSVRREAAGAKAHETGEPSLTFDRSESKSFEVRCWRAAASPAQLDVFAPHNRRVRTLKSEAGAAGWIKLPWDGKDESGKKVPTGLYFLRPSQEFEQSVRDIWVKG